MSVLVHRVSNFSERTQGESVDSEVFTDHNGDKWIIRCFPRGLEQISALGSAPSDDKDAVVSLLLSLPHEEDTLATQKAAARLHERIADVLNYIFRLDLIKLISGYAMEPFVYGGAGDPFRSVIMEITNVDPLLSVSGAGVHTLTGAVGGKMCSVGQVETPNSGFLAADTLELRAYIDPEGLQEQSASPLESAAYNMLLNFVKSSLLRPFEVCKLVVQLQSAVLGPRAPSLSSADIVRKYPEALFAGNLFGILKYFPMEAVDNYFRPYYNKYLPFGYSTSAVGGTLLGIPGLLASFPLDNLTTITALRCIAPERRFPSIWKPYGLPISFAGRFFFRSAYVYVFGHLPPSFGNVQRNHLSNFIGLAVGVLSYPFDTIHRHQQVLGCDMGTACRTIYARGGVLSFFDGLFVHMSRAMMGLVLLSMFSYVEGHRNNARTAAVRKRNRRVGYWLALKVTCAATLILPFLVTVGLKARKQ